MHYSQCGIIHSFIRSLALYFKSLANSENKGMTKATITLDEVFFLLCANICHFLCGNIAARVSSCGVWCCAIVVAHAQWVFRQWQKFDKKLHAEKETKYLPRYSWNPLVHRVYCHQSTLIFLTDFHSFVCSLVHHMPNNDLLLVLNINCDPQKTFGMNLIVSQLNTFYCTPQEEEVVLRNCDVCFFNLSTKFPMWIW